MADFTIPLTVPDDKVNDLIDALNWSFNDGEDPVIPLTAAQLRDKLKARVQGDLERRFKEHRHYLRYIQIVDSDELGVT